MPRYHLINGEVDTSVGLHRSRRQTAGSIQVFHHAYCLLRSLRLLTDYYHFNQKSGGSKMRSGLLLVALFLSMKLHLSRSSCEEPAVARFRSPADSEESPDLKTLQRTLLKRYNDLDYDSFVGLMGRRSADLNDLPPSPNKREMDDVFVGLMGRRNSELGNTRPLRKETYPQTRRGGIFFNKCRTRFRRGL
ncbi:hypothetical protein DPEC_G00013770 [Dallia pectoralis]|uniref:Uncharacterized protein n=1 Tax=Dallia pectoralis TaxID=75939 RepID=A0ACC2HLX8_DALPE|nr:hypothetical protein DPEC_G00013770 [Dallia pectoralis]